MEWIKLRMCSINLRLIYHAGISAGGTSIHEPAGALHMLSHHDVVVLTL
jgi:hypothetical protein